MGMSVFRRRQWRLCAVVAIVAGAATTNAQDRRRSPRETTPIAIGAAGTVTVTYGRPFKNGRKIFGPPTGGAAGTRAQRVGSVLDDPPLVPYKMPWRTGADEATVLTTSSAISIGRTTLPSGTYRLHTIPDERTWTVVLSEYSGQWGSDFSALRRTASFSCPATATAAPREQFTISVVSDPAGAPRGELRFEWDTVIVTCAFGIGLRAPGVKGGTKRGRDDGAANAPVVGEGLLEQARNDIWNNAYLTVAQKINVVGPLYGAQDDKTYNTQVFTMLMREADAIAKAKGFRLPGLWRKYSTFMIGALAVPWHESRWMHARSVQSWSCSAALQQGPSKQRHQRVFAQQLAATGHLANCNEQRTPSVQLLASKDTLSTGIMQIAYGWHPDYYKQGAHLNMSAAIRYGLRFYATGFQRIWNTAERYPCLAAIDREKAAKEAAFSVLRASWAGAYNAAKFENDQYVYACRFATTADARDRRFSGDLEFISSRVNALGLGRAELEVVASLMSAIEHNTEPKGALEWIDRARS